MATGWECPRCELVLSPLVTEHRCDPPPAAAPAPPGGTGNPPQPGFTVVTSSEPYSGCVTGSGSGGELIPGPVLKVRATGTDVSDLVRMQLERAASNWPGPHR